MILGQKVVIVLPAYNAATTLEQTLNELSREYIDHIVLVDDASSDETALLARSLDIECVRHQKNLGYGANQKTCYRIALERGADIIVMLHPDYQYTPRLVLAMTSMIASGVYDVCFASRILGRGAIEGGMPIYKYLSNRILTLIQNLLLWQKISEYHTGYRAYSRRVLETIPFDNNSNGFIFDNEFAAQIFFFGYRLGEISCPTRYDDNSSSISFWNSLIYGLGVIRVSIQYFLAKRFRIKIGIFKTLK